MIQSFQEHKVLENGALENGPISIALVVQKIHFGSPVIQSFLKRYLMEIYLQR